MNFTLDQIRDIAQGIVNQKEHEALANKYRVEGIALLYEHLTKAAEAGNKHADEAPAEAPQS